MKKLFLLFLILPLSAFAETVINYDDGSTYTLGENEEIYVSNGTLWKKSTMNNGKKEIWTKQVPWANRDYVEPPPNGTDGEQLGSHEWCKAYIPWSQGLTFDMIAWQRACDTNNDGSYGCGDDGFDASEDASVCPAE